MSDLQLETPSPAPSPTVGVLSFETIYAEHRDFVFRSLRRLGVLRPDVPDATQEVFVVVHRKFGTFDGTSAARTWIFGICLKVAARFRRRAAVHRELSVEQLPDRPLPATQDDGVERAQARALLDRILASLDDDKRAVFVLYELEKWSMAETAQAVGCPLQTAYSRLHAAQKQVLLAAEELRKPWDRS